MFLVNVSQKLRYFSWNFSTAQGSQIFQTTDFLARRDTLSIKLDVCLPLAYPSTIYKHFSSLMPFIFNRQIFFSLNRRRSSRLRTLCSRTSASARCTSTEATWRTRRSASKRSSRLSRATTSRCGSSGLCTRSRTTRRREKSPRATSRRSPSRSRTTSKPGRSRSSWVSFSAFLLVCH